MDDLDGGIDTDGDYRSLAHGQSPTIQGFASESEEYRWIPEQITDLRDASVSLCDICVVARTRR